MPPGPFIARDPKVVALLDAVSFPILFDNSRVEKKMFLRGHSCPPPNLQGIIEFVSILILPSLPMLLSKDLSYQLAKLHNKFIPIFRGCASELFTKLQDEVSKQGKANFNNLSDQISFDFVFRLFCDNKSPFDAKLGSSGPKRLDKWLFFQLHPVTTLGIKFLPNVLEDLFLYTFRLPFFAVKSDYQKIYDAFYKFGSEALDEAEKNGIKRDEACHNLIFLAGFNAYGGFKLLFPAILKWVGTAGEGLHRKLEDEIRTVVEEDGGAITFSGLEKMSLTRSVVYEALRLDPPVPFQYGKAKEDIVVNSHDSSFLIKKGEMIFGYQTFVTRDPKVFANAEEFVADRFVGDGEKLLKNVFWSNGRETENASVDNKQCPGKDLVVLLGRLLLVEFFLKYDTFTGDFSTFLLGPSVTIKSLTKRP